MYEIKGIKNKFATKSGRMLYLTENKSSMLKMKKLEGYKETDGFHFPSVDKSGMVATEVVPNADGSIDRTLILSTTNIIDSHMDMHIEGNWNKSIKDNSNGFYLLNSHRKTFEDVISENNKVSTAIYQWKDLGANYDGTTEALVMYANISSDRNPYMYEQYKKGYVKNHSVGMYYIKLGMAIDGTEDEKEIDYWNKYYSMAVNKDVADEYGYFFVVHEAKLIEGSSVLFGSNPVTPTKSTSTQNEPNDTDVTHNEPQSKIDVSFLNNIKLI